MSPLLSGVARSPRPSQILMILFLLATARPLVVEGAAIKAMETKSEANDHDADEGVHHRHQLNHRELKELEKFLAGGPRLWINVKPPKLPAGLSIENPDGTLKNNDLVAYLEWRRAQDPAFFDARHP